MSTSATDAKQEPRRAKPRAFAEPEADYVLPAERVAVRELPCEPGLDPGLVDSLLQDAHGLKVTASRELWAGRGDETQPDLVRMRRAVEALGQAWGHAGESGTRPGPASAPQTTSPAPEGSPVLKAARALSAVIEEGDADGRLAVLARVERIRAELGYYGAGPAARAVVDQYALATVHAEAVRACAASVLPAQPPGDELSAAVVFNQIAQAHGVAVRTGASGDERAIRARAWARRQERAERGLRSAERLVRHARKGGLLLPAVPSSSAPKPSRAEGRDDPLAPLAAAYPPPVRPRLRGAAAKDAAAERARIDVMRAAWPPPERIRWRELRAPDSPWSPWSYDFYYNDEGMIVEPAWARLNEAHETPDKALARLAEWAPEYAT